MINRKMAGREGGLTVAMVPLKVRSNDMKPEDSRKSTLPVAVSHLKTAEEYYRNNPEQ